MKNLCIIFLLLPLILCEFGFAETMDEHSGYPSHITRLKTDGTKVYLSTSQPSLWLTRSVIYDVTNEDAYEVIQTEEFIDYIVLDDMIWILVSESDPMKHQRLATHVIGYSKSDLCEAEHMVFRNEFGVPAIFHTAKLSARGLVSITNCNAFKFSYVTGDSKQETAFYEIPMRYYYWHETYIASLDRDANLISIFDLSNQHEYHMPSTAYKQYPQFSNLPQGVLCNDTLIYLQEDGIYSYNLISQSCTKLADVQLPEYFYIKGIILYAVGDNEFLFSLNINTGEVVQYNVQLSKSDRFVITNDNKLYILLSSTPASSNACLVTDLIK